MAYELHRDPRSSHQQIGRFLRELGASPILDVGASEGQLARVLAGSGLIVDGVEPDERAAAVARPQYRSLLVGRIEDVDLPSDAYPVVVCADVLEHTPDPLAVIRRLRDAATGDATFVISLPNAVHLAARLTVLAGRFPQDDRGLFDRSHLRFFTRQTALQLVRAAGLEVDGVQSTPVPLEVVWPDGLPISLLEALMRLQTVATRVRPTVFAYQWIIVARSRVG